MIGSFRILVMALVMAVVVAIVSIDRETRAQDRNDYPIRPVPFTDVTIDGGLWASRIATNRDVTVGYDFRKCEETGRINNFAIAGGLKKGPFEGIFFNDSDVFKVIEGAAYCLAGKADAELDKYLDALIITIAAAQEDDGYLYTARTINDPNYDFPGRKERWSQLASSHELYNVGHLYEAAVAHWLATGKRSLLDVALKNADLVCREFGPAGQRIDVPGHQEIEMGLVKLYRATGDEKYLRQAKFFIDMRGRSDKRKTYGEYCQDHKPVIEQEEAVGHAVRAGYLYAGVADVAALTGDQEYLSAIDRIWENIVSRKLYLTGGVGASGHGESFGGNYELPNETAYNETCAAIAQALFNHRMFLLHGDGKYIDVLERILYNGFLAGVSLEGNTFFYPNPLACNGQTRFNQGELGRSPWFGCSCCPVNVVRFVPAIAGYAYAARANDAYVNLYVEGSGQLRMGSTTVSLRQQTRYPWDGQVRITVDVAEPTEFALHVRIPGWVHGRPVPSDLYRYEPANESPYTLQVNDETIAVAASSEENGYAVVRRLWRTGDSVRLELPMPVRTVVANDAVAADRGRVAFERGPIVYCLEGTDNGGSVHDIVVPEGVELKVEHRDDLLGGVTVLSGEARRASRNDDGFIALSPATVLAVPYYAWAHRQLGEMAVWLARDPSIARIKAPPTIASTSRPSSSHVWGADTISALNDRIEPDSSIDHGVPRLTWWDHRGTTEWVQYDFPNPAKISKVEVYWFDDSGRGQCRIPQSWRLLYLDGTEWKPVEQLGPYGLNKDTFNGVRIKPIETMGVRLEVQLREGFSAGVLEWRVE